MEEEKFLKELLLKPIFKDKEYFIPGKEVLKNLLHYKILIDKKQRKYKYHVI